MVYLGSNPISLNCTSLGHPVSSSTSPYPKGNCCQDIDLANSLVRPARLLCTRTVRSSVKFWSLRENVGVQIAELEGSSGEDDDSDDDIVPIASRSIPRRAACHQGSYVFAIVRRTSDNPRPSRALEVEDKDEWRLHPQRQ